MLFSLSLTGRLRLLTRIPHLDSSPYDETGGRVLADATGERRIPRFRQRSCGFRACRLNPNGESGLLVEADKHLLRVCRGTREIRYWLLISGHRPCTDQ